MIPLRLRISGFLSYLEPVELDFESFSLACISGHNGAGKSSLLDSMTWALFGEARGKGMDVIHLNQNVKVAEVGLTFAYETNTYRVQRSLPRGKSTILEFQVFNEPGGTWKALTEKTTRETQTRIEQTLRMDYETFVNASFFLQGRADQFTQKKPGDRKAVLSTILGLEIWNTYKDRSAEKRKTIESEILSLDGRISEIDAELAEEAARKLRLHELQASLMQCSSARTAQEKILENVKKTAVILIEQRKLVQTLEKTLMGTQTSLKGLQTRLFEKQTELEKYQDLVSRAVEIEQAYQEWQNVRAEVQRMNPLAAQFREFDGKRQPLVRAIEVERARLEQERGELEKQSAWTKEQVLKLPDLEKQIEKAKNDLAEVETQVSLRANLENEKNLSREKHAALKVENDSLRREMDEYKARIDSLGNADGVHCPLCGQELNEMHLHSTLEELNKTGRVKGDQFRANKKEIEGIERKIISLEDRLSTFTGLDADRIRISNSISQLRERTTVLQKQTEDWKNQGGKRLEEINIFLKTGQYARDAVEKLSQLDMELSRLGYDAAAHEQARRREVGGQGVEEQAAALRSAREVGRRIEIEIQELVNENSKKKREAEEQEKSHADALRALTATEAGSPNLLEIEKELFRLREEENLIRSELGGAEQKVTALRTQRQRKAEYETRREELNQKVVRYKQLERAFGKDGVPALLIEQALPQIEQRANDLLDRLSDGQMSIRFVTQAEYRDRKREDLKETLDIQISDSAGTRNYEMYSGGEAFRVNFAIRLALSEILAQRKGARLQTLVIDEGFGSQDVQGRQRLIEAINLVRNDFAKILVITHLEELKDAFPNRIEIEKTDRGSTITMV